MNCSKISRSQAIGIVLIALAAFICAILLSGCATARLEKRLAPDLRGWYHEHEILMQTELPWEGGMTERAYFLSLPYAKQVLYRQMFWAIRDPEAEVVFNTRVEFIKRFVTRERYSSVAELIILCGLPDDVELFNPFTGAYITSTMILQDHGYSRVLAVWIYYYQDRQIAFGFEKSGMNWYAAPLSAVDANEQKKFQDICRSFLAPTWNGWDLWLERSK